MIIDTSAIMAILLGEPDAEKYLSCLTSATNLTINAATLVELYIVAKRRDVSKDLGSLLGELGWETVAFEPDHVGLAIQAYTDYSSVLNFGDCFSYATAKHLNEPLLFKGNDFSQTDLRNALSPDDGELPLQ